jgi:hypothetical protein
MTFSERTFNEAHAMPALHESVQFSTMMMSESFHQLSGIIYAILNMIVSFLYEK